MLNLVWSEFVPSCSSAHRERNTVQLSLFAFVYEGLQFAEKVHLYTT